LIPSYKRVYILLLTFSLLKFLYYSSILFIKTYNYLKLKSLPSSILNKCRVLLERNTKHRRITSQFGSTFRNSKWTDYSLNNLTPLNDTLVINPFLKGMNYSLIFLLVSLILLINYPTFFLNLNGPLSLLLSNTSAITYLLTDYAYILTAVLINTIILLTSFYPFQTIVSFILNNNKGSDNLNPLSKLFSTIFDNKPSPVISYNSINIESLYQDINLSLPSSNINPQVSFTFESSFYKTFLFSIECVRPTLFQDNLLQLSPLNYTYLLLDLQPQKRLTKDCIYIYLPSNTSLLNSLNNLNPFYINNLDFKKVNFFSKVNELVNFNINLSDQLNITNTLRWSYRYSNLHRRTMYNSHKLTESKKLISSGFFDINITQENLWFSDKYARSLDSKKLRKSLSPDNLISSNWKLLYNSTFSNPTLYNMLTSNVLVNNYNNFLRLNCYESSFHFFLKRLSNFNNLFSNWIILTPSNLKRVTNPSKNSLDSSLLNIYNLSLSNKPTQINQPINNILSTTPQTPFNLSSHNSTSFNKDLILIQKPQYFLTKKKVELMYNLTKYSPLVSSNFKYFISFKGKSFNQSYFRCRPNLKSFTKKIKL
jgi:hypothetical protein